MSAAIGVASAVGALILSTMLRGSPSFNGFFVFAGSAAVVGGALFLLLSRLPEPLRDPLHVFEFESGAAGAEEGHVEA